MYVKSYYQYWGKLEKDADTLAFHCLVYHSLDVAAVALRFLERRQQFTSDMAHFLGLDTAVFCRLITMIVALHDLGKFASAFQGLAEHRSDNLLVARSLRPYDSRAAHHDRLGYVFWEHLKESFLKHVVDSTSLDRRDKKRTLKALTVLMECSLGHHGRPIDTMEWQFLEHDYVESHNLEAAAEFFTDLSHLFPMSIPVSVLSDADVRKRLQQLSWHLAGVVVLADWLGSNRDYFPYEEDILTLDEYWQTTLKRADLALQETELGRAPKVNPFLSFTQHFQFSPTPLQEWAETVAVDTTPQLFILEDVTGAGKTEAALVLTHRLLEAGAADGFYFGLPTMATSNAMFTRVADYYLKMLRQEDGSAPSIVLAHAARDMHPGFRDAKLAAGQNDQEYSKGDITVTIQCNQWLGDSRKKALLAPVGVGTIDQALLAVLPRKHQSLRLLGLARKVLIFDEVHAADAYMFELLESLLTLHLHQGGSVILLTATLPQKQRQRLINIWLKAIQMDAYVVQSEAFPLATAVNFAAEQKVTEYALGSWPGSERRVNVRFLHDVESCLIKILEAAACGQCVVWIRNTVGDAIAAYQQLRQRLVDPENVLLFHSRFVLHDRQRIESRVLDWLGKLSDAKHRAGRIIITTQVFQESLDADADVMLSDLCPIDDLIQRAGRLHRHRRDAQGRYATGQSDARGVPILWVHAPEWTENPSVNWLRARFSGTQAVYRSPGRLWLGMRKLRELGGLHLPEQARQLIEAVYGEDVYEQMPESLRKIELQAMGEERSKEAAGKSNSLAWQHGYSLAGRQSWFEDEHDISTRFSDVEVSSVVLVRRSQHGLQPWVQDGSFSWELSTVRLPVDSYVSQLAGLPEMLLEEWEFLCQRNRQLKFLKPWLAEEDGVFAYDEFVGVHRKTVADV